MPWPPARHRDIPEPGTLVMKLKCYTQGSKLQKSSKDLGVEVDVTHVGTNDNHNVNVMEFQKRGNKNIVEEDGMIEKMMTLVGIQV